MSINKVLISGNLTRDPEMRSTANGMSVLGFGVAVNDRRKNPQTGDWEDYPNYIDCTMFGTRAESISRFLTKGTKVAIEGKLRWHQWEKDGQKRSKIDVIVDDIEFTTTGGTSLRYDSTGGQFIQNWRTPKGKAGYCYEATLTTDDGSFISASFKLK
ncbi:MAG: single-stranded DNA-binding protein [Actinobacteria bacterium]|nr:single-stranded DNA-binding protein [Actinomycetota bacterium]